MFPIAAAGCLRSLQRCCRGAAAIEFALVAIPLFMFIFGIIEMGRVLWLQNALHYAVEEASRCAAVDATTCGTPDLVLDFAASHAGTTFPTSIFTYDPSATCGKQVSAIYRMNLIIPFVSESVKLTSSSCFPSSS